MKGSLTLIFNVYIALKLIYPLLCPFLLCLRCLSIFHYFLSLQMEFWQHKASITTYLVHFDRCYQSFCMLWLWCIYPFAYKEIRNISLNSALLCCIMHYIILRVPFIIYNHGFTMHILLNGEKYHISSTRLPLWLLLWSWQWLIVIHILSKYSLTRSI